VGFEFFDQRTARIRLFMKNHDAQASALNQSCNFRFCGAVAAVNDKNNWFQVGWGRIRPVSSGFISLTGHRQIFL
jgi:hypothetical protein